MQAQSWSTQNHTCIMATLLTTHFWGDLCPTQTLCDPFLAMLTTQLYGEQCLRTCHWQAATASPAHTQLGSNLVRALAGMP